MSDIQKGYCQCGCGGKAPISPKTDPKRGYVKGEPRRFIHGHHARGTRHAYKANRYVVEDRGYETPCWIWQLYTSKKGYGMVWDSARKRMNAPHRVEYERVNGPIPKGRELDHLCEQRACVNPDHLEPVTHQVNIDRAKPGQTPLDPKVVKQVRAALRRLPRLSYQQVADECGVSYGSVKRIATGITPESRRK